MAHQWARQDRAPAGAAVVVEAEISVLEMPDLRTTTNENGEFRIEGIPVGSEATFVMEHPNYPLTYTKTHTIPDRDIDDLTFQVPNNGLYSVIEIQLQITSDPDKCQMVSTFTRFGKTIGDDGAHGEPGAVLTVEPENAAEYGPMYFNDDVLPDPTRSYSSLDGGVLLLNVEPGDYTLRGSCLDDPDLLADFLAEYPPEAPENEGESLRCQTENVVFEPVLMKCRAGVLINASPPWGLQAQP